MFTIKNDLNGELIVNKSRFITYVYKVNNVLEVNEKIDALKAKYKDATHYCYSYIIDNTKRFNDDKEPNHTAGMPILNVLENKDLNYVLAVVVRYFGGVKLGAAAVLLEHIQMPLVIQFQMNLSFLLKRCLKNVLRLIIHILIKLIIF